jgi:hypothetical protein
MGTSGSCPLSRADLGTAQFMVSVLTIPRN